MTVPFSVGGHEASICSTEGAPRSCLIKVPLFKGGTVGPAVGHYVLKLWARLSIIFVHKCFGHLKRLQSNRNRDGGKFTILFLV